MVENFLRLDRHKQNKIINAGFVCFGKNGYQKTSVAEIAKEADISKAAVFHYFGSKRDYYMFLYEHSTKEIQKAVENNNEPLSDDFFERIKYAQRIKIQFIKEYSGMFDYLYSVYMETDKEVKPYIDEFMKQFEKNDLKNFFVGVNLEKFKESVDISSAIKLITWIAEGYLKQVPKDKDIDEIVKEFGGYLDLLKLALYKEDCIL